MIRIMPVAIVGMAVFPRTLFVAVIGVRAVRGMFADSVVTVEVGKGAGHALHRQYRQRKHQYEAFGPGQHKRPESIGEPRLPQSTHQRTTPAKRSSIQRMRIGAVQPFASRTDTR